MVENDVAIYKNIRGAFPNFRHLIGTQGNQTSSFHSNNFVLFLFVISSNYDFGIFYISKKSNILTINTKYRNRSKLYYNIKTFDAYDEYDYMEIEWS